jgi:hypothetical protein
MRWQWFVAITMALCTAALGQQKFPMTKPHAGTAKPASHRGASQAPSGSAAEARKNSLESRCPHNSLLEQLQSGSILPFQLL